eukprot:CAMPEP_0119426954 /NCGR_PEP_ID=MMETSP1335-20130426/37331_1 /TAXON_ID=259385 /ORGANISM="Chrysoculter rhomboideus, Strain RCC1486" /LENGTH=62 /DNA_ID=CAMNT_0007452569 /DNA_START=97 /DNA_END=282 /DNA_ORIENTATION=-
MVRRHPQVAVAWWVARVRLVDAFGVVCNVEEVVAALHQVCHPPAGRRVCRDPGLGPAVESAD